MAEKMRVYELARELNTSSPHLIEVMARLHIPVQNHMTLIEPDDVERLKKYIADGEPPVVEPEPKPEPVRPPLEEAPKPVERAPEAQSVSQPAAQPKEKTPAAPVTEPPRAQDGAHNARRATQAGQAPAARAGGQHPAAGGNQAPRHKEGPGAPGARSRESQGVARPVKETTAPKEAERPGVHSDHREQRHAAPPGEPGAARPRAPEAAPANLPGRTVPDASGRRPATEKPEVKRKVDRIDEKELRAPGKARELIRPRAATPARELPGRQAARSVPKKVTISGPLTVGELAQRLGLQASVVIRTLMTLGVMAAINATIDADTAGIVATHLGYEVIIPPPEKTLEELVMETTPDDPADLEPRHPVVTVMGHVDHGKTSLLDAIRHTNVTAGEAGGITQHIGASEVHVNGRRIVFLDTPGHEAFTAMRARGAQVTDVVVLVVAADDGVMPQTIEAINHVKAAGVPIVVALNKIDKPTAEPERVKRQLSDLGLVPEEWGGDTIFVPVSARTGQGVDQLLEMILLVADMLELKANPRKRARGVIIESQLDRSRGPMATVLVREGTLRVGDAVIVGSTYGRVRAMFDDKGRRLAKAGPATPVSVLGLVDVPHAGDILVAVEDEKMARELASQRSTQKHQQELRVQRKLTLDDLYQQIEEGNVKELKIVLKADVHGSMEAMVSALEKLSNDRVRVVVIHSGVGAISESDIMLAAASNAIVIGFNVRPDANAQEAAQREHVDVRTYRVIYEAIDQVKLAMEGLLEPEYREVTLGHATVRALFHVPRVGTIAGCYVNDGKLVRGASVRLLRDGTVVYEGKLASLKHLKDDVHEISAGFECGVGLDGFEDIREQDVIEAYQTEAVRPGQEAKAGRR